MENTIAYVDEGDGPPALFVHGVFMNSRLWRGVIDGVKDLRRCIAVDLPAHGRSPVGAATSLSDMADVLLRLCDDLGLDQVDLVGNDTGGAVCQVFAAAHPERLRTFTLTNCDCHDNFPPADFTQAVDLAKQGQLAPILLAMAADPELARSPIGLGSGYENAAVLSDETVADYLGHLVDHPERAEALERFVAAATADDLLAAEPALRKLDAPTLVVWGTGDTFFEASWAAWLRDTIPGVEEVVEVDGAKLFFPDERPADLVAPLRRFWSRHQPSS
ncbi:MAG TPA: alpha/beta hydrolase [Acidimicrobiales bacterium]|jgi:pimeloyl-ACP methyl ester carboxylesterase|nr:alpha/beta hydrolase [Acidimicrobiales bacterium]